MPLFLCYMTEQMFSAQLRSMLRAAYPAAWVTSHEESRLQSDIREMCENDKSPNPTRTQLSYQIWNSVTGLQKNASTAIKGTDNPIKLMEFISQATEQKVVYILLDFHLQFKKAISSDLIRAVKQCSQVLKPRACLMLVVAPDSDGIPTELKKVFTVMDYALPDGQFIGEVLDHLWDTAHRKDDGSEIEHTPIDADARLRVIEASKGLTHPEMENAMALGLVRAGRKIDKTFIETVFSEKVQAVRRDALLNYVKPEITFDDLGGQDGLKQYIRQRKRAFTQAARDYHAPLPKGIGLAGFPGCGKTAFTMAIAAEWEAPLFQLDLAAVFAPKVGETERNMRQVTKTLDSVGFCILQIDEIEKQMNKDAVSGTGDSGTSSRTFSHFLHWLSERKSPTYVVATSNNHTILPEELIRPGRFDSWFWIDLPTVGERTGIWEVLLKRYHRNPGDFTLNKLAQATEGFTGAEIEEVIKSAIFAGLDDDCKALATTDMLREAKSLAPQSQVNKEAWDMIRDRAKSKLRVATKEKGMKLTGVRSFDIQGN